MANSEQSSFTDLRYLFEVIARKNFERFALYVMPSLELSPFHRAYYQALELFARGAIKKLIVTVPPQHGKSLGSSQLLPAYLLGLNPELKIALASYAFTLATKFNKRVQRVISDAAYQNLFPDTCLKSGSRQSVAGSYLQTSEEFEIVGYGGSFQSVGRGGGLTGNKVDIAILDDLYKDAAEGNSPTVRESVWEWYTSAVKTRLHNGSQELIVFTRWHEEDLIGILEEKEGVRVLGSFSEIDPDYTGWYKLNFEAIKESEPTEIDPRRYGAPLWPERHSLESLAQRRALDPFRFDCMYQGHPSSKEGLLYGDNFKTYDTPASPDEIIRKANYTDTADTGTDYLCSICYDVLKGEQINITDVLYTQAPMEETEPATAQMLLRNGTRAALIESNNGGRGFARNVQRKATAVHVEWFHQSGNKESRILTNSATVLQNIRFPEGWRLRWPELYAHLTTYKRLFKAHKNDDAPDALTGIVEKEIINKNNRILYMG